MQAPWEIVFRIVDIFPVGVDWVLKKDIKGNMKQRFIEDLSDLGVKRMGCWDPFGGKAVVGKYAWDFEGPRKTELMEPFNLSVQQKSA